MIPNVGTIDRILRAVVGAALILLALVGGLSGAGFWIALVVGAVLLGTSTLRFCPAYALLGTKTCKDC